MPLPASVAERIELFASDLARYKHVNYNETSVRQEFIDPLFEALGWDVGNTQGRPENTKDVRLEVNLKIGDTLKAPDYGFYIGDALKFFLEAKRPSVPLHTGIGPAFQVRRYGWSARLPVSVLTDFEELAVYDCRVMPNKDDPASNARLHYWHYTEYADAWDTITGLLGREAVAEGSVDRLLDKPVKGKETVDAAFLHLIEGWRALLAEELAAHNAGLSPRDLNYAVQMTLDRIIFLRICEDRGIEPYKRLQEAAADPGIYPRLLRLFDAADERYNSGLFHFRPEKDHPEPPDTFTPGLHVPDEALRAVVGRLYFPDSPYEFSVIPVEILGQVYEQFLGQVIRITEDHHAVVEPKPEVRKAGGVYYTPTYIVDYIVRHTVGPLLEGKTPKEVGALRILDPACGSGSFLLGAYSYLLDWHRAWYEADGPQKHRKELVEGPGGGWRLTNAERKRILLNNLYGVDIDPQAVEVTKLSLLLKVLEGESGAAPAVQTSFLRERVLPDLARNIQCGNSLIGPDDYSPQASMFDQEEAYRVNPFDWDKKFHGIMEAGGFDAVIGNPPYIRIQTMKEWAPLEVELYKRHYVAATKGNYDIYVVFIEKGLSLLNRQGRLGFILPHKFFNAQYGEPVRGLVAKGKHLAEVVHFGDEQVFAGATTYTCLLFLSKKGANEMRFVKVDDLSEWRRTGQANEGDVPAANISGPEWNFTVGTNSELFEKLNTMSVKLGDVVTRMYQGPITSADTVYLFKNFRQSGQTSEVFSQELHEWVSMETQILKSVVRSGSIHRYQAETTALVLFPYEVTNNSARILSAEELERSYPLAWKYLSRNRSLLEGREGGKFKDAQWYRFGRTQNLGMWEQPKLMIPYMITELAAYFDKSDNYYFINVTTGGYGIISNEASGSLTYLCGLLNSPLLDFYLKQVSTNFRSGYFAANKQYIEQLPIRPINFSDPADKARHDQMVALVERMLALHRQRAAARTPTEQTMLQNQIAATDAQIDRLVYALYGLTAAEIALVEGTPG